MKVTVYDLEKPDRKLDGNYTVDTTFGIPAPGDELYLRERDYNKDRFYVTAVVRRRRWVLSDNAPEAAELQLWVQRGGNN